MEFATCGSITKISFFQLMYLWRNPYPSNPPDRNIDHLCVDMSYNQENKAGDSLYYKTQVGRL